MFDLSAFDIIISMVVVLLVLSLIVQSIQSLLKKLLKLKSRILLGSLKDLFAYIGTEALVGKTPQQLITDVTNQFKELGRVSRPKRDPMLDSIAKSDLQKVLQKLHGDKLRAEIENWFDTVMQGFDERYTRDMKTVAMIVSFLLVVFLNANIFNIYRNLAQSNTQRAAVLQKGEALLDQLKQQDQRAAATRPVQSANSMRTSAGPPVNSQSTSSAPAAAGASQTNSPTPSPTPASSPIVNDDQTKQEIAKNVQEIQQQINDYKGLGFGPLTPRQVSDFVYAQGVWDGKPFQDRFMHGLKVVLGWIIMALLLSVGAPFWQDTLESLFGIKGLIRQKSKTQNVEDSSGSGQTKP